MQFKIFTIPVTDDGSAMEDMNRFLRSHKVLEAEQQLVSTKNGTQWHFCIKYLANSQPEDKPQNASKIDYKEILDEKTFAVFLPCAKFARKLQKKKVCLFMLFLQMKN